jgi:hypothetical protein
MKYFIDTEFIEGFHKPLFGKRRHFIDLISIGIVAEDGREYYAISKEFSYHKASQWVKDNVISKLPSKTVNFYDSPTAKAEARLWKSNAQIVKEIRAFIEREENVHTGPIEFYAYYADYDWVLFCSLFGTMMDLPKGFPMYCNDLKQILDDKVHKIVTEHLAHLTHQYINESKQGVPSSDSYAMLYNRNFNIALDGLKNHKFYPKEKNEHNAIDDAHWNKELYQFLKNR